MEYLTTLVYGTSGPAWSNALTALKGDDEGTIPLAIRLLTSGSNISRNFVRTELVGAVNAINRVKNAPDSFKKLASHSDEDIWKARCPALTTPYFKRTLFSIWNSSEIVEETSSPHLNVEYMVQDIYDLHDYIDIYSSVGDRCNNNDYWRGLAIIVATDTEIGENRIHDAEPFALWAAKQPNVGQIIELVKDRGTLNVETISGILEEQDQTSTPLRKGAL